MLYRTVISQSVSHDVRTYTMHNHIPARTQAYNNKIGRRCCRAIRTLGCGLLHKFIWDESIYSFHIYVLYKLTSYNTKCLSYPQSQNPNLLLSRFLFFNGVLADGCRLPPYTRTIPVRLHILVLHIGSIRKSHMNPLAHALSPAHCNLMPCHAEAWTPILSAIRHSHPH